MKKAYVVLYLAIITIAALAINFAFFYRAQNDRLMKELATAQAETAAAVKQASQLLAAYGVSPNAVETVITYGQYDGNPLQLVINNADRRVELRITTSIDAKPGFTTDTKVLEFLRTEVERLVSNRSGVRLGGTGVSFKLAEGLPQWGPYSSLGDGKQSQSLLFANSGEFNGGLVEAVGQSQVVGYWPYNIAP